MWTKPIQYGGLAGGNGTAVPGEMWYSGLSYNGRFANPLIMQGTLFYQEPWGNAATGGDYVAVNLQTGQEVWRINASATGVSLAPSFGYMYSLETPNQHGVLPNGILVASTNSYSGLGPVWRTYDPCTGYLTNMNITNVPDGTNFEGPSGEYLKCILQNLGTTANPNWYLMQWNSSKVFGNEVGTSAGNWYSGTVNASLSSAYDWNISLPTLKGGSWNIGGSRQNVIPLIIHNDKIILRQGTFGGHVGFSGTITTGITTDPANVTAISLNPVSRGQEFGQKPLSKPPAT